MFTPHKNSYLQLELAMDPRLINKAVRRAMRKRSGDPHDEIPAAQRLESMQPSLFAPCVDVSRAKLGFGRIGLRVLSRQLSSEDSLEQLQAIHTLLDQSSITESALFLISLNIIYRLVDMLEHLDPIVREKVPLILINFANTYQGRQRIMARPVVIDRIIRLFMRDRKEVRYAAALLLKTLTRDRCTCEIISKNYSIIESLLKMIKNDHTGIVLVHITSLKNLAAWDPVKALKLNAFKVMKKLIRYTQYRVVQVAMDCMAQLCTHPVGKRLADQYDMTKFLKSYLVSPDLEVIVSALGLMQYTTLTVRSRWRVKSFIFELSTRLVTLSGMHNVPVIQLRAMQVLINLCDCSDLRNEILNHLRQIKEIRVRTHEQWDGTSETTTFGLETGHNYRTMCIEGVETIKNLEDDDPLVVNVHSYLRTVEQAKMRLIKAVTQTPAPTRGKHDKVDHKTQGGQRRSISFKAN